MIDSINQAWQAMSGLELVAVVFGIAYILLAAKENSLCWYAAFISTGVSTVLFWDASLLMQSGLNIYYLLMAVYGWWQWQHGGEQKEALSISRWPIKNHFVVIALTCVLGLISGYLLSKNTEAALPYLDSFITWAAVITTWMVARKVLQNWLYWIIIDIASVYLYFQRELYLYAALFIAYTIIAGFGYLEWRRKYHAT